MFSLAWDLKELEDLNEMGRSIAGQCSTLKERFLDPNYDIIANNLACQLTCLQESVVSFVKRVIKYQRVAATHILIVMISPEERKSKPYALTVQCIAYKSIKDSEIRVICNNVIREMVSRRMNVAGTSCRYCFIHAMQFVHVIIGFTTNGEWNSLRSKGNTRPLSVFEVRSCARKKYSHASIKNMLGMLTPIRESAMMSCKRVITCIMTSHLYMYRQRRWCYRGSNFQSSCQQRPVRRDTYVERGRLYCG